MTLKAKPIALALFAALIAAAPAAASAKPFLARLHTITTLSSAVPTRGAAKGDENPYGVAVVPHTRGRLIKGADVCGNRRP